MTDDLVRAHHGSLAREQRIVIEDQLKRGTLRAIVATSSLELGIDMGAVDLVIQVESPGAVSRGLQRIGRAGHSVGQPSKGSIFPKHRSDLIETAVVVRRMLDGEIEHTRYLRNPLDVLAQQIVAHTAATGDVAVSELASLVRRCANFHDLTDELLGNVLDLLAGRYPSDEFSELRPRIVWDRVNDVIRAREGSKRLAVTSGGTIPDRGLFGVFLPDGTRVGELDEEMVYESRPGETFLLGASTWRIEDISFERVTVTPAPGQPGKMPFWHGDRPGRPLELGRALGAFVREIRALPEAEAAERLREHYALDEFAAGNVVQYLDEQAEATGVVPDDRTVVVERFRDEIGDWRVCVLSPFGTPVHAPWAMAIEKRLVERYDLPVETMWGDDGIVIRLPEAADETRRRRVHDRSRRHRRARRVLVAADVAVLGTVPRVRRPSVAAAPPPSRQAHAALAAAPEGRRPAGGGVEVPDVPDPARDVARVPAGRVRRAGAARGARSVAVPPAPARPGRHGLVEPDGIEPALQLDRAVHVRRRRTVGRASCRGARARPRSVARAARCRGAPRAARSGSARRRRARAAVPGRRTTRPIARRAARRAPQGR